jgi:hypothetical protein
MKEPSPKATNIASAAGFWARPVDSSSSHCLTPAGSKDVGSSLAASTAITASAGIRSPRTTSAVWRPIRPNSRLASSSM